MSTLKYAALYEDVAHKEFLRCLLPQLAQRVKSDTVIEKVEIHITASNKKQVDNRCASASKVAFVDCEADFFVVCRDIDSIDPKVYTQKQEELTGRFHHTGAGKTILCLPVQCIEHWLLYLKQHRDNAHSTKNDPVENVPRKEAKIGVYGKSAPKREYCKTVVSEHCAVIDIDWLQSRSMSFREFATNTRTVLQHLSSTAL